MKNALTIDLEDWYHPELVGRHLPENPESQIEDSTRTILDLLEKYRVKATFFILGDIARKHPDLIKSIHAGGHEIASHGMSHKPLWELGDLDFDLELKTFERLIDEILGPRVSIKGFRAPTFSMDNTTRYAMGRLVDNGYLYDSSIFPAKNFLYGLPRAPCSIYPPNLDDLTREEGASEILEFPLTVFNWGRVRIPISGGFYLRILPFGLLKYLLRKVNRKRPFVIYFHPWEIHAKTPRITAVGLKNYLITYSGILKAIQKIEGLLREFEFEPMIDVINQWKVGRGRLGVQEDRIRTYFDACADRFDGFYGKGERSFFQNLGHILFRKPGLVRRFSAAADILGDVRGKTILDVGCGSGIYSVFFADKGADVTGMDFSVRMISMSQKNARDPNGKISWLNEDFLKYRTNATFDYLLMIGVFDYVKHTEVLAYLEKAVHLAGDKIVTTFPKKYTFLQTWIRYLWLKRQNCPVYFYTRRQIRSIAGQLNLKYTFIDCGPIWTVTFSRTGS